MVYGNTSSLYGLSRDRCTKTTSAITPVVQSNTKGALSALGVAGQGSHKRARTTPPPRCSRRPGTKGPAGRADLGGGQDDSARGDGHTGPVGAQAQVAVSLPGGRASLAPAHAIVPVPTSAEGRGWW